MSEYTYICIYIWIYCKCSWQSKSSKYIGWFEFITTYPHTHVLLYVCIPQQKRLWKTTRNDFNFWIYAPTKFFYAKDHKYFQSVYELSFHTSYLFELYSNNLSSIYKYVYTYVYVCIYIFSFAVIHNFHVAKLFAGR